MTAYSAQILTLQLIFSDLYVYVMQPTSTQIPVIPLPVHIEAQSAHLVMVQPTLIASVVKMVTFFNLKLLKRAIQLDLMAISVKH